MPCHRATAPAQPAEASQLVRGGGEWGGTEGGGEGDGGGGEGGGEGDTPHLQTQALLAMLVPALHAPVLSRLVFQWRMPLLPPSAE